MNTLIEIQNLVKKFRRTAAVDGLDLSLPEGTVTAFLGPNGAGKTTTIKCALNLLQPDAGTVSVLGRDSRALGVEEFRQIGYVSENQEMPLWMTVRQFLDYCRGMYPEWDRDFERKMMSEFALPPDTKLRNLSRGMRMKAALLSSLAYRPRLVVLDEPFSGLDPLVRDEFIRGLLELTEVEGWTVFVSSHDIAEVERLADRVAILHQGRLQLCESNEGLQARFRAVEIVLGGEQAPPKSVPGHWLNLEQNGRVARFTDVQFDEGALGADVAKHFPLAKQFHAAPMSLREIFVALARTYRLGGNGNGHS